MQGKLKRYLIREPKQMISTLVTKCSNGTQGEKTKVNMEILKIYGKGLSSSAQSAETMPFSCKNLMGLKLLEVLWMAGH